MSNEDDKVEKSHKFHLIVNKVEKSWQDQFITGAEIRNLNASPPDWVVNQLMPGPGNDPEIAETQKVDLDLNAEPRGVKRFQVRKPATNPGS